MCVFLSGYLSDGDSPELLPRQQPSQHVITQDGPCDVSSFQLYVGSDPPRCSQRVTGLLTVHLLGLEEMKTSRYKHTFKPLIHFNTESEHSGIQWTLRELQVNSLKLRLAVLPAANS